MAIQTEYNIHQKPVEPKPDMSIPALPADPFPHVLITQKGGMGWVRVRAKEEIEVDEEGKEWVVVLMPTDP